MNWLTGVATWNSLKKDIHFSGYHKQVTKDGLHVEVETANIPCILLSITRVNEYFHNYVYRKQFINGNKLKWQFSKKKKAEEFQPLYTDIQRDCTLHSYACRQGETAGV